MAGIRHHILPRFLLKGFASKVNNQEVFTWVYRQEGKVFEANTKNVSVEKHFYGREDELSVDDEITEIEKDFAYLLDNLRNRENACEISDTKIADFVGHLSIRTKHLRDSLIETTDLLTSTLFNYLANENNFRKWLLEYYKRHPEVVRQSIDEALKQIPLSKAQRLMVRQRMIAVIRPKHIVSQIDKDINEYTFAFAALAVSLSEKLPEMLKEQHIKILAKSLISEPSVEEYKKLNWFVCKSDRILVIGDIGCLFEVDEEKRFISLAGKSDNLQNVYLPISSNTLIVGTRKVELPEIDFDFINENFVRCSRDFFVCSKRLPEVESLINQLGKDSEILGKQGVQNFLKEIIEEL